MSNGSKIQFFGNVRKTTNEKGKTVAVWEGGEIVVSFSDNLQTVQLRSAQLSSGPEKDGFTFDRVFPPGTKQHEVFDYGVKE